MARNVRAVGFRSDAFGKLAGPGRYSWMRALGNRAIRDGGNAITIDEPEAAAELFDVAMDRAKKKQRLLVFCACPFPGSTATPPVPPPVRGRPPPCRGHAAPGSRRHR